MMARHRRVAGHISIGGNIRRSDGVVKEYLR